MKCKSNNKKLNKKIFYKIGCISNCRKRKVDVKGYYKTYLYVFLSRKDAD